MTEFTVDMSFNISGTETLFRNSSSIVKILLNSSCTRETCTIWMDTNCLGYSVMQCDTGGMCGLWC